MKWPWVSRERYETLGMLVDYLLSGAENLMLQEEFKALPKWEQRLLKGRVRYVRGRMKDL